MLGGSVGVSWVVVIGIGAISISAFRFVDSYAGLEVLSADILRDLMIPAVPNNYVLPISLPNEYILPAVCPSKRVC